MRARRGLEVRAGDLAGSAVASHDFATELSALREGHVRAEITAPGLVAANTRRAPSKPASTSQGAMSSKASGWRPRRRASRSDQAPLVKAARATRAPYKRIAIGPI